MRMSSGSCSAFGILALARPPAAQSGEWTTYGGNDCNQRYSQLRQITTSNVAQVVPRLSYPLGGAVLVFGLTKGRL